MLRSIIISALICTAGCESETLVTSTESPAVTARASFEVFEAHNQEFYFNLVSSDGRVLLFSQGYSQRSGALGGVLSVINHGYTTENFELFVGNDGLYYARLFAQNRQMIAQSGAFTDDDAANNTIQKSITAITEHVEFWASPTGSRFEVSRFGDHFEFTLLDTAGSALLYSQPYATEVGCLSGAFLAAERGANPQNYELRDTERGVQVVLVAGNHQVLATSDLFPDMASAYQAIQSFTAVAQAAQLL